MKTKSFLKILAIATLVLAMTGCKKTETNRILGKWNLASVSLGWAGMQYWEKGWITYEFKENPNIVTVFISDNVATVNQPFIAPLIESGEYAYSINNNGISFGNLGGYVIRYSDDGNLTLDAGMEVDGYGYFFEK
jgi:hypothetical protein